MKGASISRLCSLALAVAALGVLGTPGRAQTATWVGGGSGQTWTTGANWSGGTAPASSSSLAMTFGGSLNLSPDMNQAFSVNSLAFASGASAFTLGSTGGYTLTTYGGGITDNSSNT